MALELKLYDALIFQIWHILVFLEVNRNKFLYVNKVQSLNFPTISISILHEKRKYEKLLILKKYAETLRSILKRKKGS